MLGNASNTSSMKYDKRLLSDDEYLFAKVVYEDPGKFKKCTKSWSVDVQSFKSKLSKQNGADKWFAPSLFY